MPDKPPKTGDEIRAAFLRFFEERGHLVMASASLIPAGDPTLLLTSAGMVPFKPYYMGDETPPSKRLVSVQKCFRTTDIDEVGDRTHHTFFEMLGNFSIGDYFKQDAIKWGWEFLTEVLLLPAERLWVTVHDSDDEAEAIWRGEVGVPKERIVRLGDKDNFWGPAGNEGPCGPSSEIHYDFGEDRGPGTKPGDDTDRFVELWNLVFVQFQQVPDGTRTPLPAPGIDTGLGLERAAAIAQGVPSAYETDLLAPIVAAVEQVSGAAYGKDEPVDYAIRVVAEHARSAAFLIADGVVPANEGRGYVLRRVIRRGIRFARKLGVEEPFLASVAEAVMERMAPHYPELSEHRRFVLRALEEEESRFDQAIALGTLLLEQGMIALRQTIDAEHTQPYQARADALERRIHAEATRVGLRPKWIEDEIVRYVLGHLETGGRLEARRAMRRITGREAFLLSDAYGFPLELTQEIAREHGLDVDVEGFEREMEAQRQRGRAAAEKFGGGRDLQRTYEALGASETTFLGYDALAADTVVVGLLKDGEPVQRIEQGDEAEVMLRETPFYPEGGGQVGDAGEITAPGGRAEIRDTQRPVGGLIAHHATVTEGAIALGDSVRAAVDGERRADVMRNHTATHMLHAALRTVLGTHVRQAGSLVAPDALRFDFTHVAAVTPEELVEIQRLVNEAVRGDLPCEKSEGAYRDAVAQGALAFFGERYPRNRAHAAHRAGRRRGGRLQLRGVRRHAPGPHGPDRRLPHHGRGRHRHGRSPHPGCHRPRRRRVGRGAAWLA